MTSLESVLHGLKYMSKRSKFIVETKIPDFERYAIKRENYEKYFRECNGKSFLISYMTEGIQEGQAALLLACFDTKEDTDKFFALCQEGEKEWSEEHSSDRLVEALMSKMSDDETGFN